MSPEERVAEIRHRLSELNLQRETLPAQVFDDWKARILKKAKKWDVTLAEMACADDGDQDYATHSGVKVKREDHAYAPPGSKPSDWKFPVHDKAHAQNALARFNQADLPADAKAGVKRKILKAAKGFGIDTSGFEDKHAASEFAARLEPRLLALSEAVLDRAGRQAFNIPIALTGQWVKGKPFAITADDLRKMKANFDKRGNGEVTVDYNHASEDPDVEPDRGISAGWISGLSVDDSGDRAILTALYAPTEKARGHIDKQEYRYVSPAIDWAFKDKESGEPQGATLTSVGLTNRPFLGELPPLQLRDVYWTPSAVLMTELQGGTTMTKLEQIDEMRARAAELTKAGKGEEAKVLLAEAEKIEAQEMTPMKDDAPRLRLHRLGDGSKKGHFAVHADGKPVGYVTAADLKRLSGDGDDDDDDDDGDGKKKMREALKQFKEAGLGEMQLSDVVKMVEKGKAAVAAETLGDGKKLLLSEAVLNGCLDRTRAATAANTHRNITTADYVAVERADTILAEAVRAGKLVPAHRKELFVDVLADPEKWERLFKGAVPIFSVDRSLGAPGKTDGSQPTAGEEVDVRVRQYLTEHKDQKDLDYEGALRKVLSEDKDLARRRRDESTLNKA